MDIQVRQENIISCAMGQALFLRVPNWLSLRSQALTPPSSERPLLSYLMYKYRGEVEHFI